MGREAICACLWNGAKTAVKALIEPPELVLRGEMRRKLPFARMKQVRADGEWLRFTFEDESVALQLGGEMAAKWAKTLLKPPPSLAKKLGITPETTVRMIGTVDDSALKGALAEAKDISDRKGDLILARVNTPADLKCSVEEVRKSTQVRDTNLVHLPQGPRTPAE